MEPWPAWDGNDFLEMPVLIKGKGKCTTDHISPAGPWLRFRGHLTNISENMYTGANNVFSDAPGTGFNRINDETGQALPEIARGYKAAGIEWIAIGDENYGEGSSREHAAMSPRHLGGGAVIPRSFARIAESNLKKQGLLALTFANSGDYELFRQDDLIDFTDLAELTPGRALAVTLRHADGSEETVSLEHTLNDEQIEWFWAGSALNVIHAAGN